MRSQISFGKNYDKKNLQMVKFNHFGAGTTPQSLVKVCHFWPPSLANIWRIRDFLFVHSINLDLPYSRYYKPLLNRSPSWIEAAPKCSSTVLKLGKWTNSWIEAAPKGLKNNTSLYKSVQVSASVCKFVQVYASICKYIQVNQFLQPLKTECLFSLVFVHTFSWHQTT